MNKKIEYIYSNEKNYRDSIINIKYFTPKKILMIYNYLLETDINKKILMLKKINVVCLYPKHKKDNINDITNYRFLTQHSEKLKLIDRIFVDILLDITPKEMIDTNIFKAQLIGKNNLLDTCCNITSKNTETIDNVVLLDVSKAFDSVEWNILYQYMNNHISKFINIDLSRSIIDEYFIIL